ncbi:MAG: pilus assembly protein PilM [Candidatus Marinimicrobia bacterium]|nr:pilus assembly protein PilM [Candidatus Neomarinimicrobiota bacterium]
MRWTSPKLNIGIDVGHSSVKMVALNKTTNSVYKVKSIDMFNENHVSEHTDINDIVIQSTINKVLDGLPTKNSDFNIALSTSFNNLFVIDIPQVSDNEIKQVMRWDMEALLPEDINNYEFDFQILSRNRKDKTITLLVGALQKKKIELVLEVMGKYGDHIQIIGIDMLSALMALFNKIEVVDDTVGFLQIGADHTTYAIVSATEKPSFITLPFGGNSLDSIIAKNQGIAFATAREKRIKNEYYKQVDALEKSNNSIEAELFEHVVGFTKNLIHFNAHYFHKYKKNITQVYATGGLVNDLMIAEFLKNEKLFLNIPCQLWDPIPENATQNDSQSALHYIYGPSLGVALHG